MKITGKIYVFANKKEDREGNIHTRLVTNVTDGREDSQTRLYIDVRLRGDNFKKGAESKFKENTLYEIDVKDGFLACRSYENQDGFEVKVPVLVILDAKVTDAQPVGKKKKSSKTDKKSKKAKKSKKPEPEPEEDDEDEEEEDETDPEDADVIEDELPF